MRNSDRAWVALAGGVAAYDLIATDDEQLTNAARRYFKSQPIATASMILVTAPHLVCGIPPWFDPITLTFASATDYRPIGLDSSGCFLSSVVPERTWSSDASSELENSGPFLVTRRTATIDFGFETLREPRCPWPQFRTFSVRSARLL
jgi:hypothetical protein